MCSESFQPTKPFSRKLSWDKLYLWLEFLVCVKTMYVTERENSQPCFTHVKLTNTLVFIYNRVLVLFRLCRDRPTLNSVSQLMCELKQKPTHQPRNQSLWFPQLKDTTRPYYVSGPQDCTQIMCARKCRPRRRDRTSC